MTSNEDAAKMPEEIYYGEQTTDKGMVVHFASRTPSSISKTRYIRADGFEKYLADRVDDRVKEALERTPAAQGDVAEAIKLVREHDMVIVEGIGEEFHAALMTIIEAAKHLPQQELLLDKIYKERVIAEIEAAKVGVNIYLVLHDHPETLKSTLQCLNTAITLIAAAKPHPAPVAQSQEAVNDLERIATRLQELDGSYSWDVEVQEIRTLITAATQNQPAGGGEVDKLVSALKTAKLRFELIGKNVGINVPFGGATCAAGINDINEALSILPTGANK